MAGLGQRLHRPPVVDYIVAELRQNCIAQPDCTSLIMPARIGPCPDSRGWKKLTLTAVYTIGRKKAIRLRS